MARHVVLGKGPIGSTLAHHLAAHGDEVLVLSRSGGRPADPAGAVGARSREDRITAEAIDGTDGTALAAAAALLLAAERTGAVLVTAGNLYGYGEGAEHMTEDTPLRSTESKGRVRATLWRQALERHDAGVLRTTEVRGSDYLGPGAEQHAHAGPRMLAPLLAGRRLRPIGSVDQPHSWTYLPDFAAALAAAAGTDAAWGRAWHVPSPEPLTVRELARRFAAAAGAPEPRITPLPIPVVRALGVVSPMLREVAAVGFHLDRPFVLDSERSQAVLGVRPTAWDTIVAETLAAWPGHAPTARSTTAGRGTR